MYFSVHRSGKDDTTDPPTLSTFDYYGSGTCCWSALLLADVPPCLPAIPLDELEETLITNCQEAVYEVADRTTFEIAKQEPASDILALDNGHPHLLFAQVMLIGDSGTCACVSVAFGTVYSRKSLRSKMSSLHPC